MPAAFPTPQPTLDTARLTLRPFAPADAPDVERYAGDRDVAAMTLTIPHPYPPGAAEQWIASLASKYEAGEVASFAITVRESGALAGAIGLHVEPTHNRAELGYWIAKPYWGRGYATEAAEAMIGFGFDGMRLNKIHAAYFLKNPASARVIEKIGMTYEGHLREHDLKWGVYEDIKVHAILAREWAARGASRPR